MSRAYLKQGGWVVEVIPGLVSATEPRYLAKVGTGKDNPTAETEAC